MRPAVCGVFMWERGELRDLLSDVQTGETRKRDLFFRPPVKRRVAPRQQVSGESQL